MRNNKAIIYTSSYDRGLEHLLKIFPEVKAVEPLAELHIFYGWDLFTRFYRDNPASMAWKAKMDELMKADGITHHGRVPQTAMKEWIERSGIWAYPTHFGEISCISAMKAQAWGAIPVCVNYAALETTVAFGKKVEGDIYEKETQDIFKEELIKAVQDDEWQEKVRPEMMKWARNRFSWEKVAQQWTAEFNNDDLVEAAEKIIRKDPKMGQYLPVQLQTRMGMEQTL